LIVIPAKKNIIFANLPYIPSKRISQLDASVKNFEPIIALDGGEDGLKYIDQVLKQAKSFLKPEGHLLLEVDDTHLIDRAKQFENLWNIKIRKDHAGKNRFWICKINIPPIRL